MTTLTALPAATEYIEIDGVTVPVAVTQAGDHWAVLHLETGNFGYGATVKAAVLDCRAALLRDRRWYTVEYGARLILEGVFARRRQAIWALFGTGREGR